MLPKQHNIKWVVLFHALTSFAPSANTLASYCIGFDVVGLENTPSFDDANFLSLDQVKYRAYSLYRFLLCNTYIMSMIVHLSIGV
jgi:hypothetical protein